MPEDKDPLPFSDLRSKGLGSHQGSHQSSHHSSHHHHGKKKHRHGENDKSETLALTRKSQAHTTTAHAAAAHGTALWKGMMRKFSQSHKETCKSVPKAMPQMRRSTKTFPTGSTYTGTWNSLGMTGEGTYTFPHKGVVYKGNFDDGVFHGDGELHYECGAVIKGNWHKGDIIDKHLYFDNGLEYIETDWAYCRMPDRRFAVEYDEGIEPAGKSYLTADQPPMEILPGFYDVGDGVYELTTKTVYKYDDLTAIVRYPTVREHNWTLENCRVSPDLPKGPCPFLYEKFMTPTLEAEPEVQPPVHCKTYTEEDDDPEPVCFSMETSGSQTIRAKLFTSRMTFGGVKDFYNPNARQSLNYSSPTSVSKVLGASRGSTATTASSVFFKLNQSFKSAQMSPLLEAKDLSAKASNTWVFKSIKTMKTHGRISQSVDNEQDEKSDGNLQDSVKEMSTEGLSDSFRNTKNVLNW